MAISPGFSVFWSRRFWRVVAVIGVFGVVAWYFRSRVDPFERIVARVRDRGQATVRAELERQFPFNPLAYSNYRQRLTICSNLPPLPTALTGWIGGAVPAGNPQKPLLTVDQVAAATEWLTKNSATLDQLTPWLVGPRDFGYGQVNVGLENSPPIGTALQGFCLRAALAYDQGDVGASVTDVVAALRMFRRHAPELGEILRRVHFTRVLALVVEPMLRQHRLSGRQMEQIEEGFGELLEAQTFHSVLRWQWVDTAEQLRRDLREPSRWWLEPGWPLKVQMFLYSISGLKRSELTEILESSDELAEAFVGPMPQRRVREQAYQQHLMAMGKRLWHPQAGVILGSYLSLMERELWQEGWLRTMVATLAVERFRRQHGHLPADLEEVSSATRAWALVDPNDGQALRYRETPTGYMIYSVGLNGIDDGGRSEGIPDEFFSGPWNGDITMEVSLGPP